MIQDFGYIEKAIANIKEVAEKQEANIKAAATLMADAIQNDRLINVYAGGGHTTLAMGEMFFRAGGLANINPMMETALSVFNQALKYLALERTVNFGASIIKYYDPQPVAQKTSDGESYCPQSFSTFFITRPRQNG